MSIWASERAGKCHCRCARGEGLRLAQTGSLGFSKPVGDVTSLEYEGTSVSDGEGRPGVMRMEASEGYRGFCDTCMLGERNTE